ncbi:MAG: hypothetical protein IPN85_05495 [Flavobacteriales bacterium]|nr:hypothetical protein [Flavobacteriales bacterium]
MAQGRTVLTVDTIRAVQPWHPHAVYTFPHLRVPERPQVAERIQRHLCIDLLEADPDTAGDRLFGRVWGDTATARLPSLYDLTWEVHQPLQEVVDFEISAEGCGAYCEGFTRHYVYDLRDGHYLDFDSLLTPAGLSALNDTLDKRWRTTLGNYMDSLGVRLSSPDLTPEDTELVVLTYALYRDCMEEREGRAPYVDDIQPLTNAMRFFISRCAAHVNQNLDELDPLSFELPYGWLAAYLRPELKSLFR